METYLDSYMVETEKDGNLSVATLGIVMAGRRAKKTGPRTNRL